jgi:hypothetical protein
MIYTYTEVQFIEQSAIGLFAELGWQTVSAQVSVPLVLMTRAMALPRQHNESTTPASSRGSVGNFS